MSDRTWEGRAATLQRYLQQQAEWSLHTFGPGTRAVAICKHIEKEVAEIRSKPYDLVEWIDVIILALDGYWRAGGDPVHIMDLLKGIIYMTTVEVRN